MAQILEFLVLSCGFLMIGFLLAPPIIFFLFIHIWYWFIFYIFVEIWSVFKIICLQFKFNMSSNSLILLSFLFCYWTHQVNVYILAVIFFSSKISIWFFFYTLYFFSEIFYLSISFRSVFPNLLEHFYNSYFNTCQDNSYICIISMLYLFIFSYVNWDYLGSLYAK